MGGRYTERLPEIRETYSQFFNQSESLQYGMTDQKTEIYENAVEVGARYEIEQVLRKGGSSGFRVGIFPLNCTSIPFPLKIRGD